jgi:predicted XRE-type DNA-binding protein
MKRQTFASVRHAPEPDAANMRARSELMIAVRSKI